MTSPDNDLNTAKERADAALAQAERVRDRSDKIAEGWRRSRSDNNFRHMLRALGQKAENSD